MDDILKMASVTKRTILRDLKTLKEVLVTKKITFDEEKKAYIMEDII
jgi:transcriptional antiterminator